MTTLGYRVRTVGRRDFLKMAGAGAAGLLMPSRAAGADDAKRPLPNMVFILADDMGYGDLACQNPGSKIPTPNLDRLAGQGVRFTDAHSPSAVCSPTRYGILTGRYAWRSRLKSSVLWPWDPPLIEPGRLTVPAMLKKHGYRTACIGKWHLGWNWPFVKDVDKSQNKAVPCDAIDWTKPITGGPLASGFDYYFGDDVPNFPPYTFIENEHILNVPTEQKPGAMFGNPGPMSSGWKLDAVMPAITRKAVEWIEGCKTQSPDQPFFLYFPLTAPHTPIVPAAEFKGKSRAGDYGDYIVEVDWAVGEVLKALEQNGLAEDTLVIFTSDNGPENYAYARVREHLHYSMGQLRGIKRDTWEGGHRVPFLARWPGRTSPGTIRDEILCLTDLMATVAAVVGAELPEDAGEDSYSMFPALVGEKLSSPIREATVHHSCSGRFAIRKGRWVFIDAPTGDDNKEPLWFKKERGYVPHDQPGELYDLSRNLTESTNVYAENPEIAGDLKTLLEKYKREGRSTPP
ncbi:MAG TPA: sulfatase-like hydrolase/transferase [Candidatus Bathyarchaeia archaeon]|nr:sulfatase-like hydrolase/transferase [Candidatus Bathyarchaeia archaeon]